MDIFDPDQFFKDFPRLRPGKVNVTSSVTPRYNCIAWAAGDSKRWWWPAIDTYWPDGAPRVLTVEAFVIAYGTMGFRLADDNDAGKDYERIAIFTKNGVPTHAARQLPNGQWTSKCGTNVDIEHGLKDLDGPAYGTATHFLVRAPKDDLKNTAAG